jgi:preprotein translocase subunit YajC
MIDSPHVLAWLLAASSSKSSSSSSSSFLLLLIPLVVLGYFLLVRPQRQRARQQQAQGKQFTVGDWIMTVGGIAGQVVESGGEWIKIEVASGVQLDVLRQAVSRRLDGDPGAQSSTYGDRWAEQAGDGGVGGPNGDRWAQAVGQQADPTDATSDPAGQPSGASRSEDRDRTDEVGQTEDRDGTGQADEDDQAQEPGPADQVGDQTDERDQAGPDGGSARRAAVGGTQATGKARSRSRVRRSGRPSP